MLGLKPWSHGCSLHIALPICVLSPSFAVPASLQEFNWKLGGVCQSPRVAHLTVLGPVENRLEDASLKKLPRIIKDLDNKELHLMPGPCVPQ